jgi:hypothetical protein
LSDGNPGICCPDLPYNGIHICIQAQNILAWYQTWN